MLLGHKVVSTGRDYGNMQAILWRRDSNEVTAASDPRGIGSAEVRAPGGGQESNPELEKLLQQLP